MSRGQSMYQLPAAHGGSFVSEPTADLELSLECHGLRNMDLMSKSDPMAVVYLKDGTGNWREIGRTETIMDCLDPKFAKSFPLQYFFERTQWLKFDVYDVDSSSPDLSRHDFIGGTGEVKLADIVAGFGSRKTFPLHAPGRRSADGAITVHAEEMSGTADVIRFRLSAKKLANVDGWFSKSDPFVVISRQSHGKWVKCYETNVVMDNLNPTWAEFTVSSRKICGNDPQRPVLFEVLDWESSGSHQPIGHFQAPLIALETGEVKHARLLHPKGKKKDVGTLIFNSVTVEKQHTFCDFLAGGCEIGLMTTIDFTASNGDPRKPGTLHYMSAGHRNEYEQAIETVGGILTDYDSDGLVPAFGFGARFPNGQVSHCFSLNGQADANCKGVAEIIHYYKQAIANLQLYGPTNFSVRCHVPCDRRGSLLACMCVYLLPSTGLLTKNYFRQEFITRVSDVVREARISQEDQQYFVLLVLTDGVITDMDQTISAIVAASELPLSIIIVGVGAADFSAMERLDADTEPLRCGRTGKVMERDIVQFVPYAEFKSAGPERLAMEVLEEVPGQMLSYFSKRGIVPNPPPPPAAFEMATLAGALPGGAVEGTVVSDPQLATAPPVYDGGGGVSAAHAPPPAYAPGSGAAPAPPPAYSSSTAPPPSYSSAGAAAAQTITPAQKTTMVVTVPAGVSAGQMLQVQTPSGALVQIQVPAGVVSGQQIQIQV